MPNIKTIISSHNKKLLSVYNQSQNLTQTLGKECNCRKKNQCSLEGKRLTPNVVYQATVKTETSTDSYVGLATNFKERYRNHTASFRPQVAQAQCRGHGVTAYTVYILRSLNYTF